MKCSLSLEVWLRRAAAVAVIVGVMTASTAESQPALIDEGRLPDLGGAVGWLNSAPLNSKSLRERLCWSISGLIGLPSYRFMSR